MISLDFLEKVDVFSDLGDAQLEAVRDLAEETTFQRGEKLFAAGQTADHFWVVVEGQVDLTWAPSGESEEEAVSQLGPGMPFGWSSLVPGGTYNLNAVCVSRTCRVARMPAEALLALFRRDAEIGYRVMRKVLAVISTRFYQLQDDIARRRGYDILHQW